MQNTANASLAEKSQLERHTSFSAASATHRKCDRQLAFNLGGNVNLVIHVCIRVDFTALNRQSSERNCWNEYSHEGASNAATLK